MTHPLLTITGNLTADPELRYTKDGDPVANFTVADTPQFRDSNGEWQDGETIFMRCTVWRQEAENVAESLRRGMRIIVTGKLKIQRWQDNDGNAREAYQIDVTDIGASMKFGTLEFRKAARNRNEPPDDTDTEPPRGNGNRRASNSRQTAGSSRTRR
jgi:single-strand DNA-binding protein